MQNVSGLLVKIGDEESISEPQEIMRTLQLNAREFLQPVVAQSMHADRVVEVTHRDERVAASRRGEPLVPFGHVNAVEAYNLRAALHTEGLHIRGFYWPMSTRESLSLRLISDKLIT